MLALDYGSARCGCAITDPTRTLATPIEHIERAATRRGMKHLASIVRRREIVRIVVGLPLSMSGGDTEQTDEARAFAQRLRETLERTGRAARRAPHDGPGAAGRRRRQRGLARCRAPARGVAGRPGGGTPGRGGPLTSRIAVMGLFDRNNPSPRERTREERERARAERAARRNGTEPPALEIPPGPPAPAPPPPVPAPPPPVPPTPGARSRAADPGARSRSHTRPADRLSAAARSGPPRHASGIHPPRRPDGRVPRRASDRPLG